MDLTDYHETPAEKARVGSLLNLLPTDVGSILDIGSRDGFITRQLADRVPAVTALDLRLPAIDDRRIACVQGDASALTFEDNSFDLVFCAEVLEHIPEPQLSQACREIARVSGKYVLIGVPFEQDTRLGRVTCRACGRHGPPWGHVNSFDEEDLSSRFGGLRVARREFVGTAQPGTNAVSSWLMDLAGNPYGTYAQEETCSHCGAKLAGPAERSLLQRISTRLAVRLRDVQMLWHRSHPNWVHLLFEKPRH